MYLSYIYKFIVCQYTLKRQKFLWSMGQSLEKVNRMAISSEHLL